MAQECADAGRVGHGGGGAGAARRAGRRPSQRGPPGGRQPGGARPPWRACLPHLPTADTLDRLHGARVNSAPVQAHACQPLPSMLSACMHAFQPVAVLWSTFTVLSAKRPQNTLLSPVCSPRQCLLLRCHALHRQPCGGAGADGGLPGTAAAAPTRRPGDAGRRPQAAPWTSWAWRRAAGWAR